MCFERTIDLGVEGRVPGVTLLVVRDGVQVWIDVADLKGDEEWLDADYPDEWSDLFANDGILAGAVIT